MCLRISRAGGRGRSNSLRPKGGNRAVRQPLLIALKKVLGTKSPEGLAGSVLASKLGFKAHPHMLRRARRFALANNSYGDSLRVLSGGLPSKRMDGPR
jgi:hypothetical protein